MNKYKKKKVALVGGAGFIGHNLALYLKDKNLNVQIFDHLGINNLTSFIGSPNESRTLYWNFINERINLLNKRAELMKSNEKFSQDICNILKEAAEEKMETASQEDAEPEETIYSGGFDTFNKDVPLFEKFHSSEWKERLALLDKFKDDRLVTFGHSLIYNEAPEILPKDIHKKIKRRIASRILSTNKEKWWTVSAFYSECDEIRENEDKMFSFKTVDEKLKFLDGINDYVMNLEQKYSDA